MNPSREAAPQRAEQQRDYSQNRARILQEKQLHKE